MNRYKMRDIIEYIRRQGKLPTDPYGQILPVEDLLAWFGLDKCLSRYEQSCVKKELAALAEAELAVEKSRMDEQLRSDSSA